MYIIDILNFYEEVKDDLKFLNTSGVRIKIMLSLSEGPKKTKDLREIIGVQSSTILHGVSELEKQNLVSRKGDDFYLSELGEITALKLEDMIRTSVSLKKFRKLWLNHKMDNIPPDLLMQIGDLSNSELIESKNEDMSKTHNKFIEILLNSRKIKGVSPIFHHNYTDIVKNIVANGTHVELILTEDILKKTIKSLPEEDLKKLILTENLTIWRLKENVKIAFTVTDKFLSLGLFSKNGVYDSTKDLVSEHHDAIAWGNKLFEHYLQKAEKVNLEYFNR